MNSLKALFLSALLAVSVSPVWAEPDSEQGQVREQRKAGNVRSLRQIEQRVLPQMQGMQYLGPEYDPIAMAYRLKFIKDGRVQFVDVDARSGRILGHSR
jgi:hypothetical protein